MNYTKGRWIIGKNSFGQAMVGIRVNEKLTKFRGVALISSTHEMKENAKLISKSPEMLEALKWAVLFIDAKYPEQQQKKEEIQQLIKELS